METSPEQVRRSLRAAEAELDRGRSLATVCREQGVAEETLRRWWNEHGRLRLRTERRPGDLGRIVTLHGETYAREYGFDESFEAYVAGPLAEVVRRGSARDRIWIAERSGTPVGCIAIVGVTRDEAQLRWYLVAPSERGAGLGSRLMGEALAFGRACGYRSVFLWTVSVLAAAARRYQAAGFRRTERKSGRRWGVDVVEERYELTLEGSA